MGHRRRASAAEQRSTPQLATCVDVDRTEYMIQRRADEHDDASDHDRSVLGFGGRRAANGGALCSGNSIAKRRIDRETRAANRDNHGALPGPV